MTPDNLHPISRVARPWCRSAAALAGAALALGMLAAPARSDSFEDRIDALESKAAQNAEAQRQLEKDLAHTRDKTAELEAELADSRARASAAKQDIKALAVDVYKSGGDGYLRILLTGAESHTDYIARLGYADRVMKSTRQRANAARDAKADAETALKALRESQAAEQAALSDLASAERVIESALAEQRRLYEESKKPPPPPPTTKGSAPVSTSGSSASPDRSPATSSAPPATSAPAPPSGGGGDSIAAHLARIRQCESGGNYTLVSASGVYSGAYQFSDATWASVGGSGRASDASPAEQDMRARMLYERSGPGQWPHCSQV